MAARSTFRRQLPADDGGGGFLVPVGRIVADERIPASLDEPAPRWELWLAGEGLPGRWSPAAAFCAERAFQASLASTPSGLTVVARPTPEGFLEPGERPADAKGIH